MSSETTPDSAPAADSATAAPSVSMDALVSLCKRRGFVYQASEIYGGLNGFWDYGPLGTELKNNIRDHWWNAMVHCPPIGPDGNPVTIVGLDSSIIQNPTTWEASGHLGGFSDPMVDCRETKSRYRADHLVAYMPADGAENDTIYTGMENQPKPVHKKMKKAKLDRDTYTVVPFPNLDMALLPRVLGPDAAERGTLTEPREFNLMFKTFVGATSGEDNVAYLRPETAQGIFLNYKVIADTMRVKMPFGIAQVGKSFRNEVTPRNFIFRSREFEQMEMEWFCPKDQAGQWLDFWKEHRLAWWRSLGITSDRLIFRDHTSDELSHYAKEGHGVVDIEYLYPFTAPGYGELEGIAHRGNYDLSQHKEFSKVNMEWFDQETKEKFIPDVIEPASGLTRAVLVVLCEAYTEEWVPTSKAPEGSPVLPAVANEKPPEGYEVRSVLKFLPQIAPVKVAVFPLLKNKPALVEKAQDVYRDLRTRFTTQYDATGAIGRRYRRQDEIGTPYCVTIDFDTIEKDNTVTLRDRDTMQQERVPLDELAGILAAKLA